MKTLLFRILDLAFYLNNEYLPGPLAALRSYCWRTEVCNKVYPGNGHGY